MIFPGIGLCIGYLTTFGVQLDGSGHGAQNRAFVGVLPNEASAIQVGRSVLRGAIGNLAEGECEPLKANMSFGRWVVSAGNVKYVTTQKNKERYLIALDPLDGRVVCFGAFSNPSKLFDALKAIPPDHHSGKPFRFVCAYETRNLLVKGGFGGFLPNEQTAVEVARVVFSNYFDTNFVRLYEPLFAIKQNGFWIVAGRKDAVASSKSPDYMTSLEPYKLILDPYSARIAAMGVFAKGGDLESTLKRISRDQSGTDLWRAQK